MSHSGGRGGGEARRCGGRGLGAAGAGRHTPRCCCVPGRGGGSQLAACSAWPAQRRPGQAARRGRGIPCGPPAVKIANTAATLQPTICGAWEEGGGAQVGTPGCGVGRCRAYGTCPAAGRGHKRALAGAACARALRAPAHRRLLQRSLWGRAPGGPPQACCPPAPRSGVWAGRGGERGGPCWCERTLVAAAARSARACMPGAAHGLRPATV